MARVAATSMRYSADPQSSVASWRALRAAASRPAGFGPVHGEAGGCAETSDSEAGASGRPLSEGNADDRFVGGGTGNVLECEARLQGNGDGGDKARGMQGEKIAEALIEGF